MRKNRAYLIANWKMNLPPAGVEAYIDALAPEPDEMLQMVIAPPFPYISHVDMLLKTGGRNAAVGAQDCSPEKAGAFTGEVSAAMLADAGATFAIVGHSERRARHHESDGLIGRKIAAALEAGIVPVFCIGEDLETREAGRTAEYLGSQIGGARTQALDSAPLIVVAYEPIWAIGTGRNASGSMVAETRREIREALARLWPSRLAGSPVIYGGSVTPDNVTELTREGEVDGFLVGGASLDARKFEAIAAGLSA